MNDIERLLAIEDIKQLKARYFRCMDTKDWDGFAAVFSDDAVMDMSQETGEVIEGGGTAIADYVRRNVHPVETVHHGHMPEIDVTSPDAASGVWAMMDVLRFPAGGPMAEMVGYGHYHETYAHIGGEWKITRLLLTRLRRDVT